MIILMKAEITANSPEVKHVVTLASRYPGVRTEVRHTTGVSRGVTEVHLIGSTAAVPTEIFEDLPAVERAIRIKAKYRTIGRHEEKAAVLGFQYNGLTFDSEHLHIFAGLCAVDTREHVDQMFAALKQAGIQTSRAGVYKPRTSPYEFQGLGAECLPYVFELAGKHGIKAIAMEVTSERHVEEITNALHVAGSPTGVILQVGTRNAQNFELLKEIGQQAEFPVLFKRGMGITLEESLNACEYVASSGNSRIIFCLRGVKSNLGDPHRNLVDFSHVPVVQRLTRMLVCIDPSHSVGRRFEAADGLLDIHHVTAQGIIAGATAVLVDFHPHPDAALCDGPQALRPNELAHFIEDARLVRNAYLARREKRAQMAL